MDTARIQLPRHGLLTFTATTDADRGEVTYQFRAPHAAGALVLTPCHTALQHKEKALPNGVRIQFGTGERWPEDRRADLPTIYGVRLVSGVILDPFEYLCGDDWNRWIRFHRPTGRRTSCPAPDATTKYMSAIVAEVLIVWCSRPDVDQLVLAVARREAPGRLASIRTDLQRRRDEIAKLEAEIAQLETLAAGIRAVTETPEVSHP
ncbi:MAG: hypothetical protein HOV87_11855 [Catenulispora sp.]|nr:hypothetical protein [Catenulispora sp.]NUT43927.1 hypothetical protein [Thermoactinospora sp.]